MMFLSRIKLNPRRRAAVRFRSDPQSLHAAVAAAFPPEVESRPLWRLDKQGHEVDLYLVSRTRPSFEHLQEQAGWAEQRTWDTRDYDGVLDRLQLGDRYRFRLVANPVHTVTFDGGEKRRLAHVSAGHQRRWLIERAQQIGVRFLASDVETSSDADEPAGARSGGEEDAQLLVEVSRRRRMQFSRGRDRVTIAQAQYDGAFEVADPERLRAAMRDGVGRAKAYGCGLLTIAPLYRS